MIFKQIASYDNYLLANMTLGLLQENNINCYLKDENIVTIDPLLSPAVGGIKLMIKESDWSNAVRILKDTEEAYLKEITCPNCKNNTIKAEEKISIPTSFLQKIKYLILFGQSQTCQKRYRCQNCNSIFTQLPISK